MAKLPPLGTMRISCPPARLMTGLDCAGQGKGGTLGTMQGAARVHSEEGGCAEWAEPSLGWLAEGHCAERYLTTLLLLPAAGL